MLGGWAEDIDGAVRIQMGGKRSESVETVVNVLMKRLNVA